MLDNPLVKRASLAATTLALLSVVVGGVLFLNNMRASLESLSVELHEARMTQELIRNELAVQSKALEDLRDHLDDLGDEHLEMFGMLSDARAAEAERSGLHEAYMLRLQQIIERLEKLNGLRL